MTNEKLKEANELAEKIEVIKGRIERWRYYKVNNGETVVRQLGTDPYDLDCLICYVPMQEIKDRSIKCLQKMLEEIEKQFKEL